MSPVEKRFAIFGIIIGVGSLAVALGQWSMPNLWRIGQRDLAPATQISEAAVVRNSAVTRLMRSDTIGASLQYVEAIAGPAKHIVGPVRIYDADGCRISVYAENSTVDSIRVQLTPTCTFDWSDFYKGFPSRDAFKTTVGNLAEHGDHYFEVSCYGLCGRSDKDMRFRFVPAGLSQFSADYVALVDHDETAAKVISSYGWPKGDGGVYCAFIRDDGQEIFKEAFSNVRISAVIIGAYFNENYESMLAEEQLGRPQDPYFSGFVESGSTPANKQSCLTSPDRPE